MRFPAAVVAGARMAVVSLALVRAVAGEGSNALVVAASTLAVAAAFGPVRRRV